jgi:phage internal scaffolding protein
VKTLTKEDKEKLQKAAAKYWLAEKAKDEKQDRNKVRSAKDPIYKYRSWNIDDQGECLPGRTTQSHKDECDIKNIIRRHDPESLILQARKDQLWYGDFTEVNEYQEAQNLIARGKESFEAVPAEIRERFNNDPGKYLEFVSNPENTEEMIKLGLAQRVPDPEVNPEAAAAAAAALEVAKAEFAKANETAGESAGEKSE